MAVFRKEAHTLDAFVVACEGVHPLLWDVVLLLMDSMRLVTQILRNLQVLLLAFAQFSPMKNRACLESVRFLLMALFLLPLLIMRHATLKPLPPHLLVPLYRRLLLRGQLPILRDLLAVPLHFGVVRPRPQIILTRRVTCVFPLRLLEYLALSFAHH